MQAVTPAVATGTDSNFTGTVVSSPDVAVAGGSEIVSWNSGAQGGPFDQNVQFFTANGASSGSPQKVGSGDVLSRGNLAFSPSGYALDVFTTPGPSSTTSLSAASRAPGGSFGALTTLDPNAGGASDTIDDTGDGLAAFVQGTGASSTAQIRGFDVSPPTITKASIPATATAGTPVAFSASTSDFWGPVTISWNFGDGGSATGANPSHTFAAASSPTVTVTATDSVGNTATKSGVVSVAAAPGGVPTKAALSRLGETNSVFAVGGHSTPLTGSTARAHKHGTVFSFLLDQPATVKIPIQTKVRGRRVGRSCRADNRRLRHKPRCATTITIATLTRIARAGLNKVAFSGRIRGKALKPGRYQAAFTAIDSAGASNPKTLSFTVVKG
jgi:PKD repeat protein